MLSSLADQGLSSGAHFAASILLARVLTPAEYGAFSVTFAVFLLAAGIHNALLLEPAAVIGPSCYGECLSSYLAAVIWMHAALSAGLTVLLLVAAAALAGAGNPLSAMVAALGLAAPCILLFWLFRRACYLKGRPDQAVTGSLLYAAVLIAGLAWLARHGRISAPRGFLLMGLAGLGVSVLLLPRIGVRLAQVAAPGTRAAVAEAARRHWKYARWSLGSTLLYWLASSIYLPAIGALAGLPAVAAYRATENLLLPMGQSLTALGLLLLPWVTAEGRARGGDFLGRAARKIGFLAGAAAGVYTLAILAAGPGLSRLVYGGDQYANGSSLIPCLGVAIVLRAIGDTGFGVALRAAGRPDIGLWSTLAAAIATLTAGLGLVARHGAGGAAAGWMISSAASCAVTLVLFGLHSKGLGRRSVLS